VLVVLLLQPGTVADQSQKVDGIPAGLASPKLRKGAAGRFQSWVMLVQLGL